MPADFTHLHLHTLYSLLDGAIRLPDLMESCARTGMKSVAVTDHGNMFGVVNFYQEAKKAGVKPIIGFEAYVAGEKGMANKEQRIGNHLVLLAMNDAGYRNLRYLSTKAFQEGFYYDPRVDKPLLRAHNEGIIALTACMAGAVPKAIRRGDMDEARREARELKEIFGDRLYLEVQSNALKEQLPVNHGLCELSKELQIPLVATADSHYVKREDAKAHEVLMAIASGRTFDDPRRLRHETEELYIKGPEEMASAAEATTGVGAEWREAVHNSWLIGQRCNVELNLTDKFLPKFQVPEGETLDSYIQRRSREGLDRRFAEIARAGRKIDPDQYRERLGRGIAGRVRAADHRHRPVAVQPPLREVPEPRARVHAGLRRGLLPGPPGRGDRLRHAEVRDRERRADHHLRGALGEERDQGRGPGDGRAVRGGERADAEHPHPHRGASRHHPEGAGSRAQAHADPGAEADLQDDHRVCARPGGPDALDRHARGGRGDRGEAALGVRAALPGAERRIGDAVREGRSGARGADQVRLPRPDHPDGDQQCGEADQPRPASRGAAGHRAPAARRQEDLPAHLQRRHRGDLPDGVVGLHRDGEEAQAQRVRGRDRGRRALPAGSARVGHGGRLHQPEARARAGQLSASAARTDLARHVRSDRLPGAGDADRAGAGRLLIGPRRPAPPRDGEEEGRPDGERAQRLRRRLRKERG